MSKCLTLLNNQVSLVINSKKIIDKKVEKSEEWKQYSTSINDLLKNIGNIVGLFGLHKSVFTKPMKKSLIDLHENMKKSHEKIIMEFESDSEYSDDEYLS